MVGTVWLSKQNGKNLHHTSDTFKRRTAPCTFLMPFFGSSHKILPFLFGIYWYFSWWRKKVNTHCCIFNDAWFDSNDSCKRFCFLILRNMETRKQTPPTHTNTKKNHECECARFHTDRNGVSAMGQTRIQKHKNQLRKGLMTLIGAEHHETFCWMNNEVDRTSFFGLGWVASNMEWNISTDC